MSPPRLFLLFMSLFACAAGGSDKEDPPHRGTGEYRNPYVEKQDLSLFSYWRTRWFGKQDFPDPEGQRGKIPSVRPDLEAIRHSTDAPQVTWIGHSTVLLQVEGVNILTDPILSERASPLPFAGPRRFTPPALDVAGLPPIDVVVISHNHYDHLDLPTVRALGDGPRWLVPLGLKKWFQNGGIAPERVTEFDWWQSRQIDALTVTATPLQHWSGRAPWDRRETLWAGWALEFGNFSTWFAGDTGYNERQFREIGRRLGPFDLALIPIGGYAPRWFMAQNHVDPGEAVRIHRDVRARRSIGIHWGAFVLTAEPVEEPPRRLAQARHQAGIAEKEFTILKVGETLRIPAAANSFETDMPLNP